MIATLRYEFNELSMNTQLIVLLSLLNLYDFLSTKIIIGIEGFVAEGNPVLLWAMEQTGTVWVIFWIKLITLGILTIYSVRLTPDHKIVTIEGLTRILIVLNIAFGAICVWNSYRVWETFTLAGIW